jgi:recombination protein RecT
MATQIAERRADPVSVVRQTLTTMGDQLKMALPSHVSVDKFHRVTMTAIQSTPALLDADRRSLFGAITKAAQDGLLPDGREGALVMFGKQVQWMPMVAGILKKVRQSGELVSIAAHVVYEADDFIYRLGDDESIEHCPPALDKPRGNPIGVYAVATLTSGAKVREVMSKEQIEKVRKVSRASGNGPWVQWWEEMARKTVIRRLSKRLPMSTDIEAEFERDETMQADAAAMLITSAQPAPVPMSRLDAIEHQIVGSAEETAPAVLPEPGAGEPTSPDALDEQASRFFDAMDSDDDASIGDRAFDDAGVA